MQSSRMTGAARPSYAARMNRDPAQAFRGAVWYDVLIRARACPHLPRSVLLHAGPPFQGAPPTPVVQAAIQSILFEEWAGDERTARAMLLGGEVVLRPAQDHGVVTPLAQVVSSSMPLAAIRIGRDVRYGAVLEGAAPALRFGSTAAECRHRLRALASLLLSIAPLLRDAPVDLAEPIRRGIGDGDDGHSRTATINAELVASLRGLDATHRSALSDMSAFVLPLLMAAASAAMAALPSSVVAIGANGVDCGVRRGNDAAWCSRPASPPVGVRLAGSESSIALPAIGDSIVVDFCGLGGLIDAPATADALLDPVTGIVDPRRIEAGADAPMFNLAVLDAAGALGLIGRGTYRPDRSLFSRPGLPRG